MPKPLVLIVEDEGLIALHLTDLLTEAGYPIAGIFPSGEEALERFGTLPYPGVVLMDISLGGNLDGIETARRMRLKREVPIIFITAHAKDAVGSRIRKNQQTDFLIKPTLDNQILVTIEKVTDSFPASPPP